jgi:hypothetical protein
MGRGITRYLLAATGLVCCSGCGVPVVGLAPESPPVESKVFSRLLGFTPVDSLTPTLRWEALDARTLDAAGEITDVTYELRVWETSSGYSGHLVYVRDNLQQPSHQLEEPLRPGAKYLWTVRAHFTLAGQRWVTEWGMAGYLLRDQVVPNAACFRFETPPRSS